MNILRAHPRLVALTAVITLLGAGAIFVMRSAPVTSSSPSQTIAWNGTGGFVGGSSYTGDPSQAPAGPDGTSLLQQVQSNAPYNYTLPQGNFSPNAGDQEFNIDTLLALIAGDSGTSVSASSNTNDAVVSAYEFVPSGLIATTSQSYRSRTPAQRVLYEYGNEVGSTIQAFESLHPNQAQVLKDQAEDRTDLGKAEALKRLGNDFANVGKTLLAMEEVPASLQITHDALARSYIDAGEKLALVADAANDAEFVASIQGYDDAADVFIRNYVTLAQLLSSYDVRFSPEEPGSVFTFSSVSL